MSLPDVTTGRWTAQRKAQLIAGIREGVITLARACERYGVSAAEVGEWMRLDQRHGTAGLRVCRLQHYRIRDAVAAA